MTKPKAFQSATVDEQWAYVAVHPNGNEFLMHCHNEELARNSVAQGSPTPGVTRYLAKRTVTTSEWQRVDS